MVKDTVVDNVMTGAPASHCKQIQKGDVVVEIDGTPVTPKNIIELLVGNDVPGSSVTLKLARNSRSDQRTLQVVLKRASTAELADKKKMFQLFTHIKDLATHKRDAETGACVDETIELWSKMVEADQVHDEQIVKNVEQMQGQAHEMKLLQLQNAAGTCDLELAQGADANAADGDVHDDGSAVHGRSHASTPSATSQSVLHSPGSAVPKLCGVGLMIAKADAGEEHLDAHGGRLWVSRLVPNGAAALSKSIRQHDELLAVDGQRVHELQDAFDLLRGPRESKVCLCVCVCVRAKAYACGGVRLTARGA